MARSRSGFYNAIEYVGPRPQKPKKPNLFGGWVILAIAAAAVFFIGKPLVSKALASEEDPTRAENQVIIDQLESSEDLGSKLAAEALRYTGRDISYDRSYYKIDSVGGDIPSGKGMAADMIVRCYRSLGIDLQEQVHADMEQNFRLYPQLWKATGTDANIDHRRVANLQRFFKRKGETLSPSRNSEDYEVGDIVVWALSNADTHIGIVVPGPAGEDSNHWVAHHPAGEGPTWENGLFSYQIVGHFRYPAE